MAMKRTILVVAAATAIVLAMGVYAWATTRNVAINAQVNPAFSMTLPTSGVVNFGTVAVGASYTSSGTANQQVVVKSNKPWDYSSTQTVITAGTATFPFGTYMTDNGSQDFGTGIARGVTTDDRVYTLDLSTNAAYDIPASTPVTATITYTAVQQ
jgi:hypothetical protein